MSPIIRQGMPLVLALCSFGVQTHANGQNAAPDPLPIEVDDDAVVIEDRSVPVEPPAQRPPTPLPPALQQIRESQGGSIVRGFTPQLYERGPANLPDGIHGRGDRSAEAPPHWRHSATPDPRQWRQRPVDLLRDSAWHLDGVAQRLEVAELYDQADDVRQLAQRLRLAARERAGDPVKSGRQTRPTQGE